ncbi:NlpC/P60 family protein [Micromonospora sp. WMMD708]|uniref:C40 family peptidase n=1 Tax=Micromonospora sp. WMMD708 TaxID=3403464 RepID=UPI003BF5B722
MAHHAPRPPSHRSTQVARDTTVPRPRWSRFTTTLATLAAAAVVLTGGPTAAHADPSVAEIERQIDQDWNKLEPLIEQHNATRIDLAAKRRQADALGKRIAPLQRRVDQAMNQVSGLAVQAYKGENVSTVNALLGSRSPSQVVEQLGLLDRFASRQQREVQEVARLRDELAATKAPLDEMVAQLTRTEAQLAARKKQINTEIDRLQKLRLKVYGNGGGGKLRPAPCPAGYPGGPAGTAVKFACAQIGKLYVWGAAGPNNYDCSGLTMAAWAKAGVSLPHNARQQRQVTDRVSRADLRPGDLVFYYSDLHHVGMYVGGGWVVHASQAGKPITMKRVDDGPVNSYGRPG